MSENRDFGTKRDESDENQYYKICKEYYNHGELKYILRFSYKEFVMMKERVLEDFWVAEHESDIKILKFPTLGGLGLKIY